MSRWLFFIGLACGSLVGWQLLPEILYCRQEQPMSFDHAVHADEADLACEDCHVFRADGSFAGIPQLAVCVDCHEEPLGESEAERRLVADFIEQDREIPWLVYARQPQNVYFSHAAHVHLGEIECRRCHGDRGRADAAPPLEINRISTYSRNIWGPRISGGGPQLWDSMKMSDCSACHAERGVQDHCLMCHK